MLSALIANHRIELIQYGLDGSGGTVLNVPSTDLTAVDHAIEFDFGVNGIGTLLGANSSSTIGDGYYEIALDLDGNGTFETALYFDRLFGDVNGDRTVDINDINTISAAMGQSGVGLLADVNGDGTVNANDRTLATRSKGRSLSSNLHLDA